MPAVWPFLCWEVVVLFLLTEDALLLIYNCSTDGHDEVHPFVTMRLSI